MARTHGLLLPFSRKAGWWADEPDPTSTHSLTKDPMHRVRRSKTGPKRAKLTSNTPIPGVLGADSEKGP